ncbi:MAG: YceD family protein, partial [Burkholderiaceae bacterium]|nr:YceD family protein [Burkholderiaceae bacterium]
THISLECQRCLKPVDVPLVVQRRFLFVHGEDAAAQLDTDSEDDVLALSRTLNLIELIEDELLLGLPLVPRHSVCPQPLRPPADPEPFEERANPFAVLGDLKRKSLPN